MSLGRAQRSEITEGLRDDTTEMRNMSAPAVLRRACLRAGGGGGSNGSIVTLEPAQARSRSSGNRTGSEGGNWVEVEA